MYSQQSIFIFKCSLRLLLVLFDVVVDKNLQVFPQISTFFDFDLQVFGLLGLRGLHYIVFTLKFTMGFFKGSFY